uniref:Serine/threonine-protein kinase PpkA n=1 Tax=Candidatus Kentrum sp. FW TaxID=2126338 RepID=A0A450U194_9GAMM|nr:MAG: serine/threonine-protein kinase PpkA [Candidatus Kentron sp. FW]
MSSRATEAEWEYAARGGTSTAYFWGDNPMGSEPCDYANVRDETKAPPNNYKWSKPTFGCEDGYPYTAPVESFYHNPYALNDMSGNVAKWTCSLYDRKYREREKECTAKDDTRKRVVRGDAWNSFPQNSRAATRWKLSPEEAHSFMGFRLAKDE